MLLSAISATLSFAAGVVAGIPGEVVGGRSESILHGRFCQIRDRLNELSADANRDLQRAIHAAYWQALSLVCAMRAEQVGINADALFMRDKATDFFTGWLHRFQADAPLSVTDGIATEFNSSPGLVAGMTGWLKQRLRPDTPQSLVTSAEIEWLERALLGCWERTAQVRETGWQPSANEADEHFEALLLRPQPDHANHLTALRDVLTAQMEGDVALAFGEPPVLLDGTCPLRYLLQKHWYELFRGCFHAALKSDPKVFAISQSQMLAELVCRAQPQGNGASLTVAEFTSALETLNQQLRPQFERVIQTIRDEHLETRQTVRTESQTTRTEVIAAVTDGTQQVLTVLGEILNRQSATPLTEAQQQERAQRLHELLAEYNQGRVAKWSEARYALNERFVNLTLLRDAGKEQQAAGQERWQAPAKSSFHDLNEALAETQDDPAVVLLGVPGSGKSTLLRHLQLQHCAAQLAEATGAISLLADLNEYHGELAPREWLLQIWRTRAPQLAETLSLERCLNEGRVLLLLDALNEMSSPNQTYVELVGKWHEFIKQDEGRNRIVFTCRSLDYTEPLSSTDLPVPILRVQAMDEDQMREFIDEYAPTQAQYIWDKLEEAPPEHRLFELYQTPFYLRLLCEQVEQEQAFPAGRAALFTGFVRKALKEEKEKNNPLLSSDALLSKRDRSQITQTAWGNDPFALPAEGCLLRKLSELAFKMQRRDKLTQSTLVSVSRQQAIDYLGGTEPAQAILDAGVALKILDTKNLGQTFTFFHQLVQEYFAARQLARQPEPSLTHVEWEVGKVNESLADKLASLPDYEPLPPLPQTGWEVTTEIAAPMADDPEAFISDLIAHNLPLAARCAVSPEVTISDELKQRLQAALLKRATDQRTTGWRRWLSWFKPQADLRARITAGEALGLLGHPRFTQHKGDHGEYLLPPFATIQGGAYLVGDANSSYKDERDVASVTLAPFGIGVYPVTNAEYALFMRAGGYDKEQWWNDTPAALKWLREGGREAERERLKEVITYWRDQGEAKIKARTDITSSYKKTLLEILALDDDEFETWLDEQKPPDQAPPRQPEFWNDTRFNLPTQPVVGVTWHEARAYCNWLTANADDGQRYRLPTEAEFEAAAQGKAGRQYPYGKTFETARCNTFESHIRRTTPVGIFANATPEGAFDLSGNAWTWTLSLYQNYPYDADDGREKIEAEGNRVLRGGSWNDNLVNARAANRDDNPPADRDNSIGFRVAVGRPPSSLL